MNDNKFTVVDLPERNAMKAASEVLRREIDAAIENIPMIAKVRRVAYLAYIAEGFTEEQALQLCVK
jgi:hypothetical protein